jgi:hypothetical protein
MPQKHKFEFLLNHNGANFLITGLQGHKFEQIFLPSGLRIFKFLIFLIVLSVVDMRIQSLNFIGAVHQVLVEGMGSAAVVH